MEELGVGVCSPSHLRFTGETSKECRWPHRAERYIPRTWSDGMFGLLGHQPMRNTKTWRALRTLLSLRLQRMLRGQGVHLLASGATRQTLGLLFQCPWEPLVVGALCPFLVLGLGEVVKRDDARVYNRYVTLLRLEFDTRLGMHSPR